MVIYKRRGLELSCGPLAQLNKKMLSYQYGNYHYRDKTVSRPLYIDYGNPKHEKTAFVLRRGPGGYEMCVVHALCSWC